MHKHPAHMRRLSTAARIAALIPALALMIALGGCGALGKKPESIRGGYAPGNKVTVLLPGSGPVADAADAVREGVRAAHGADDTAAIPELAFADTGKDVAGSYGAALEAGATQVIGPIEKPAVDALAAGPALAVPTLALNEGTFAGKPAANLFQFALSPESEGIDIADKAASQGFARALMLYAKDSGGTRRADAFRRQWKTRGGTVVGEAALAPGASASAAVSGLLGEGPADFVFLAVDADQAREVYPELREAAPALPVVATASVYPGDPSPARDRALAGLHFVDMPWMLGVTPGNDPLKRADLRASAPYLGTPLGRRLYAMGIDAYRLAPRLTSLAADPAASFPGQTGRLSVDSRGGLRRELMLARFTETGPEPVKSIAGGAAVAAARTPAPRPQPVPRPEPAR